MVLQEVFNQLSATELSQVSIGGQPPGVINQLNWKKLIPHIQSGLTELYKRFNLKEGQLYVLLEPGVSVYHLADRYTHPANPVNVPGGTGTNQPGRRVAHGDVFLFKEDILKIERVFTLEGVELHLNDFGRKWSVRTPDHKTLQIPLALANQGPDLPCELKGDRLTVIYRANHPNLTSRWHAYLLDDLEYDPDTLHLELPDAYLEPLIYYVASRFHNPIGMGQEFNAGNTYAAKFERACQILGMQNLEIDNDDSSDKLRARGFV